MSNAGPVCHIPPKNQPANPQPANLPGIPAPVSPPTSDSGQAQFNTNVANAINMILKLLSALANSHGGGQTITNNATTQPAKQSTYQEVGRQTQTVRVFQNNDKTSPNWVDVEQINGLKFQNPTTKETLSWTRGSSGGA